MEQRTRKVVKDLKVGDVVRPERDWEAANASILAEITLNPAKGYTVAKALEGIWLALEPTEAESHHTTVIFVHFKDPNKQVEVLPAPQTAQALKAWEHPDGPDCCDDH